MELFIKRVANANLPHNTEVEDKANIIIDKCKTMKQAFNIMESYIKEQEGFNYFKNGKILYNDPEQEGIVKKSTYSRMPLAEFSGPVRYTYTCYQFNDINNQYKEIHFFIIQSN